MSAPPPPGLDSGPETSEEDSSSTGLLDASQDASDGQPRSPPRAHKGSDPPPGDQARGRATRQGHPALLSFGSEVATWDDGSSDQCAGHVADADAWGDPGGGAAQLASIRAFRSGPQYAGRARPGAWSPEAPRAQGTERGRGGVEEAGRRYKLRRTVSEECTFSDTGLPGTGPAFGGECEKLERRSSR